MIQLIRPHLWLGNLLMEQCLDLFQWLLQISMQWCLTNGQSNERGLAHGRNSTEKLSATFNLGRGTAYSSRICSMVFKSISAWRTSSRKRCAFFLSSVAQRSLSRRPRGPSACAPQLMFILVSESRVFCKPKDRSTQCSGGTSIWGFVPGRSSQSKSICWRRAWSRSILKFSSIISAGALRIDARGFSQPFLHLMTAPTIPQ